MPGMPAHTWMQPRHPERFAELVAEFHALALARTAARKRQDKILIALRRDGAPLRMIAEGVRLDSSVVSRRTRGWAHRLPPCTRCLDADDQGVPQTTEAPT